MRGMLEYSLTFRYRDDALARTLPQDRHPSTVYPSNRPIYLEKDRSF
jgi:hypothetical protein